LHWSLAKRTPMASLVRVYEKTRKPSVFSGV
jgi:hypothetical protein